MSMLVLSGPKILPDSGVTKRLIIIFHGYGADGANLIGLAEGWKTLLPDTAFIAPNAPDECEITPFGRQWFSMQNWTFDVLKQRLLEKSEDISEYIKSQAQDFGVGSLKNVALVGFSQGAMLSLFQAVYGLEECAGAIGYSGGFLVDERLKPKFNGSAIPRALLVHGDADELVPCQASLAAEEQLQSIGVKTQLFIQPGIGHEISPEGFEIGAAFLQDIFNLK
jgi:phospholipase/carboxylesterase